VLAGMKSVLSSARGINAQRLRQARTGVVAGMLLGLFLNGFNPLPMDTVHAALTEGVSVSEIAEKLGQGDYRVAMHCPVKNRRVVYQVKAHNAGGAHMALEWVMPACELSGIAKAQAAEAGKSWFHGEFVCQGSHYRKTVTVAAADLGQASKRARASSSECRIETIDQTACPFLSPLCERESNDYKVEAELETHRLLR
jgi:hypothetical protein